MQVIQKCPTGINGLDAITGGGLPRGRTTLICGGPGCGKTLFSTEFIVKGATRFREPGVLVAFEERADELAANVASLGFDLQKLQKQNRIRLDHIHIERSEIDETGEYDLDGLFIRLSHAIDSIGAKRVVLDTIENLFSGLSNQAIVRSELRRLFHWLKDKGVTSVITAETGDGILTRHGLEEYVSDCVIALDHRVVNQISTRSLRVIKYRGSFHGTNEYPFLIDEDGISVLPLTAIRLERKVSSRVVSSGLPSLDSMLSKKGFFRGSSVLVSGSSGTGKTSIAAHFVSAACARGEKAVFFAFEESPMQIVRNMRSIGLDLETYIKKGLLKFQSSHPSEFGLEMHLVRVTRLVEDFKPQVVVVDPITNLINVGQEREVKALLMRLIDILATKNITLMFTALTLEREGSETTDEGISSLVDAWIQLRQIESNGERNKELYVLKARGMGHSNQVREFLITGNGVRLVDIYMGEDGILTGSARLEAMKSTGGDGRMAGPARWAKWAKERQDGKAKSSSKKGG
jgi:circadian clock protein KaiC